MLGNIDFANFFVVLKAGYTPARYLSLAAAREAGAVTLNYGLFTNRGLSFFIVAFAVFLLVKGVKTL